MAFPLIAAAIGSMLAGSLIQKRAMDKAAAAQRDAIAQAQAAQAEYQRQAEAAALEQAAQFEAPKREEQQQQITEELKQQYLKPVQQAAPINDIATRTAGEVSSAYENARSQSAAQVAAQSQRLAAQMAGIHAAARIRGNEGQALGETARAIDQIGSFARGQGRVDDVRIREAGKPNASRMMIGQLLSTAGQIALGAAMSGGFGAGGTGGINPGQGLSAGGGMGLRAGAGFGIKAPASFGNPLLGSSIPLPLYLS